MISSSTVSAAPVRRRFLAAASALVMWLAAACSAPPGVADLARNEDLYASLDFHTRLPGDRSAFVAPVVDDRRTDVLPAGMNGYPITYDEDGRWERPVVAMIDDVLRQELAASGLFTQLVDRPTLGDVIVEPRLETFLTASMELERGARAIGEVALRIRVFGPMDADGHRPLVHEEVYGERQMTPAELRTVPRHFLAGSTLRTAMMRLLNGLDGANVGRDGMPTAPLPMGDVEPASTDR